MSRVVVFDEYGSADVLRVAEVDTPEPGPGQVLILVRAAGVQPYDIKMRRGDTAAWAPAQFPQQLGAELAGKVETAGALWTPGDEVIGWAPMTAHASHVVIEEANLVRKPPAMPWAEAGALTASGQTAATVLDQLEVQAGELLLIHAAAGGVGSYAMQLAVARGAQVIGTASERNHAYLRELGAAPVAYGAGLIDRLRELAPDGVDAALDCAGTEEALEASAALVKDPHRWGSIAAFRSDVRSLGTERSAAKLQELVDLFEQGKLRVEIAATYPLDDVVAAHRAVEAGHTRGKVVLTP